MKSMTGYGVFQKRSSAVQIDVVIRVLNNRFFEVRHHFPREYLTFEMDSKKIIQNNIYRGSVEVFVHRKSINLKKSLTNLSQYDVAVNWPLARAYHQSLKELCTTFKLEESVLLGHLLDNPNLMIVSESLYTPPLKEKKLLLDAIEQACCTCNQSRAKEGLALNRELELQLKSIEEQIKEILSIRNEFYLQWKDKWQTKMQNRLKELQVEGLIDPTRMAQEIAIQLDRTDIHEELARLEQHIHNYRFLLGQKNQPQGKQLDFYTQELLREMNTIGSKSNHSKITQCVVQAKTAIERLREQVQNIE